MDSVRTLRAELKKLADAFVKLADEKAQVDEDAKIMADALEKVTDEPEDSSGKDSDSKDTPVSEEAKDALVEAITDLDPELGDELQDNIDAAEEEEDKPIDGEKLARFTSEILSKYRSSKASNGGRAIKTASYSSGAGGNLSVWEKRMMDI